MIQQLIDQLKNERPAERGEASRRYAILITELEKANAYYLTYIKEDLLQQPETITGDQSVPRRPYIPKEPKTAEAKGQHYEQSGK